MYRRGEKHRRKKSQRKYYNNIKKPVRNKEKDLEASRSYRFNNKNKVNAKKRLQKKQKRDWLDQYKKSQSCKKCGENRWFCLDFHHMDSNEKEVGIADLVRSGYGFKRIKEEISKCIVLCANCHRHLHFDCGKILLSGQTREWLQSFVNK
tara:strand:- start:2728 stop:3177 length:450 start_codon:yes stop_codon:yes gene_type:complete